MLLKPALRDLLIRIRFFAFISVSVLLLATPPFVSASLTESEINEIKAAKARLAETDGHDYSRLYAVLESKKGRKDEIFSVCSEGFNPIFCLKKASEQNPELRTDICGELERRITAEYSGKMSEDKLKKLAKGHKNECEMGIPQMSI